MSVQAFQPLAIVGYGCVFPPDACNPDQYWQNILNGKSGIMTAPPDRWRWELFYAPDRKAEDKTYCKFGGFVEDYAFPYSRCNLAPRDLPGFNRTQLMILDTLLQAAGTAGYGREQLQRAKTGLFVGNMLGDEFMCHASIHFRAREIWHWIRNCAEFHALPEEVRAALENDFFHSIREKYPAIDREHAAAAFQSSLAVAVGGFFNTGGATWVCDAACASGLLVIDLAARYLGDGSVDVAMVCGAMGNMNVTGNVSFAKIGGLSQNHSLPLDARADGLIPGEGAGAVILKRLADALRDGDPVYGVIRGIASRGDGKGKAIYAPASRGQVAAMRRALETAKFKPGDLQYIETHATATPTGDRVEIDSLKELFSDSRCPRNTIALGSGKSLIGHTFSAAGMANLIKILLGFKHGTIPPTHGYVSSPPEMGLDNSPFYVNTSPRPWPANNDGVRRAATNAFGFGGINTSICVEDYAPGYHETLVQKERGTTPVAEAGEETPVAVIGVGCLAPGVKNSKEYFAAGRKDEAAAPFPEERWHRDINTVYNPGHKKTGCFMQNLDFPWRRFKIPPRVLAQIDRSQLMALVAAEEAMRDCGDDDLSGEDTGIFVGSLFGLESGLLSNLRIRLVEYEETLRALSSFQALDEGIRDKIVAAFIGEVRRWVPETGEDVLPGYMDNIIGGRIANIFDVRGMNVAVDAGGASFAAALEAGIKYLVQGECRTVLVGGVHANMTPEFLHAYELYRQQSNRVENGGNPSPGPLPAEGAAFFVLKKLADVKEQSKVYGVINGVSLRRSRSEIGRSSSAGAAKTFYFGADGAFSLLGALSDQPALLPGPVTVTSFTPEGGEYSLVVDSVRANDFCDTVYLGANSLPELLAELNSLLTRLEKETPLLPNAMPAGGTFPYRLGIVYNSRDELKRKAGLALLLLAEGKMAS